jgi:PAS domain S-box-containing protein
MQNITDRKRIEQALLDSEERFHLMAGLVTVLMWWSGPDRQCTNVNQEWLKFTGRTMQEELGNGWLDKLHSEDLQTFLHICFSSMNKGQNTTVEYRMQRNDGHYRWMRCTRSPRLSADGRFVGYIGCCVDVTDEKEAKIASAEFGSKLIRAQEEERARIARELHDDINQRLAILANGLQNFGSENPPADANQNNQNGKAQELWRLTNEIAADIQHLSHQLHPSKMRYLGLTAAVRDLCQGFSRQHDIAVECIVQDLPRTLEDDVSLNLYRTIQECLHNVAKHSQARHVKVELTRKTTFLHLRVSDDGIGFNPADVVDKGLGLLSIRERLRSVGGELSIWSRPSLGTQLEGTVPATNHARFVQASVFASVAS